MNTTTSWPATLGIADYSVFGVMLGISMAIGVYLGCFGARNKTVDEYLLGSRKMQTIPIAISLISSQMSGITIMAVPAEIYSYGSQYSIVIPMMFINTLFVSYIIIPVYFNLKITSSFEYMEMRFGKVHRHIACGMFIANLLLGMPVLMFIPSMAFSQVSGINVHLINMVVCAVCVFYTMLGGIKAVVWTDVVQAVIMMGSCLAVAWLGVLHVGGASEVWRRAEEGGRIVFFNMDPSWTSRETFWNQLLGSAIAWIGFVGLNQSSVQRIMSLPEISQARRALTIFCFGFVIIMCLCCFTGVVMYANYYDCDPIKSKLVATADRLLPYFILETVGHIPGMPGLFIACVFSAALSTLSPTLNTMAGILYQDYIQHIPGFNHSEARAGYIMKSAVIFMGIYCVLAGILVENFGHILQVMATVNGISQGTMLGMFTLGMLAPRANQKGAAVGALASLFFVIWIAIGAQTTSMNGSLRYPPLPTSIDGCQNGNHTMTMVSSVVNATTKYLTTKQPFILYRISFFYYPVIGLVLVWIVGLPASYLTRKSDLEDVDPKLLSPVVHWMLPKPAIHGDVSESELVALKS